MSRRRSNVTDEKTAEAVEQVESTDPEQAEAEPESIESEKTAEAVEHRFEEFDATRPDGSVVHIRRNIDTGEQTVTE